MEILELKVAKNEIKRLLGVLTAEWRRQEIELVNLYTDQ